jgi:pimeloyl-ACP methyl ester carboxylesterase
MYNRGFVFNPICCITNVVKKHTLIRKYKIELTIYYGEKDSLTPISAGEKFISRLNRRHKAKAVLKTVNDGHFFIREPLNKALSEDLNKK